MNLARSKDAWLAACQYLDLVPKARDESGEGKDWLRRRDQYDR
jgi:predicted dithiol-disulfide oxidoreductase (DUF899 family)